jgi:hypothetical protein
MEGAPSVGRERAPLANGGDTGSLASTAGPEALVLWENERGERDDIQINLKHGLGICTSDQIQTIATAWGPPEMTE